jgi:hypothetical protein
VPRRHLNRSGPLTSSQWERIRAELGRLAGMHHERELPGA